jgi:magnesium transporter
MQEDAAREREKGTELESIWPVLSSEERIERFSTLGRGEAERFFRGLTARGRATLIVGCPPEEQQLWLRQLAPDDAADVLQEVPPEERSRFLALIDERTRLEVIALLAYAEDEAGGLMNPRFARVRPDMTVGEAISYLRRQARNRLETIYYAYVLDAAQHLRGVVSFRELFASPADTLVRDVMHDEVVSVPENMDQEAVADVIAKRDLLAVPVVDPRGRMKGIVTVDDIVDVVHVEATEDIQKIGGQAALGTSYFQTGLVSMLKKRAGWLTVLFLGEMLTASAMGRYQADIAQAAVLVVFVPLIIASGGNSGSQASTLIIRAMALDEIRLRNWGRVLRRELAAGLGLGLVLAMVGVLRVFAWQGLFHAYGEHSALMAAAVGASLVGVVTWGTVSGSMLPLILRAVGFDPASASAPLVATVVDVAGLVIYFTVAELLLRGSVL